MKAERGYPGVNVTPKAEAAILRGHPWVYDTEILSMDGTPENREGRDWDTVVEMFSTSLVIRLITSPWEWVSI